MQNFQLRWQQTKQGSIGYAWFEAMHTRLDLVVFGTEEQTLKKVLEEVYDRVRNLEKICNRFDPESEVSQINNINTGNEIILSNDLFHLLQIAQTAFINTAGLFDISIQTPAPIPRGADKFVLNTEKQTIIVHEQGLQFDFGGLAKGYAVDIIREIFNESGFENYLISFGNSSIAARGNQPGKSGWHVSLQNGSECFELHNECLSISGNDYHPGGHIIDPKTGEKKLAVKPFAVKTGNAVEGEVLSTVGFMGSVQ
jgi:thiamine biosynthesis lipoprotein